MTVLAHHPKAVGSAPKLGEKGMTSRHPGASLPVPREHQAHTVMGRVLSFLGLGLRGQGASPTFWSPPQGCWPATTVPLCFRSRGYASSRTVPLSEPSSRWHLVGRTAKLVRVPRKFSELSLVVLEAEGPWKA